jgi:sestrin
MSEVLPLRMILPPTSSPSNRQQLNNSNHNHNNSHHLNNESQQQCISNSNTNSALINNHFISNNNKSMTSNDSKNWSHNADVVDDGVTQIITCHPNYKDPFVRTHNFILRGDGPLSYATRQYIAIMASARHQCTYLVNLSRDEFLASGGDPQWLQGLDHIPQKLKDLNQINKLLAHQPWLINKTHIEKLTKGSDSWSLSELVHAIVILSHFHALSSFVFGCNIGCTDGHTIGNNGDEKENGHNPSVVSNSNKSSNNSPTTLGSSPTGIEVETLMKRMQSITEQKGIAGEDTTSQEDLLKNFDKLEYQTPDLLSPLFATNNGCPATTNTTNAATANTSDQSLVDLVKFIDDPQFGYEDFARRREESEVPTFRVQDYSWDDHGFSLVNRLYSDIGNLLDEKFKICYNLTYYTMGNNTNIDTSPFRRAIWNYIQSMYGIRHDDYDYREVNILLERNLKSYIKSLCCYPHRVFHNRDYSKVMRGFRPSEKIHVNLMIFEARLQAELLYALRAVMRHMT